MAAVRLFSLLLQMLCPTRLLTLLNPCLTCRSGTSIQYEVLIDMYVTNRCRMQALEGAKSLEEVTIAHSRFVDAAQRQCLLAPDKTWKLIEGVVVQILNQVLQFAELQQKLCKPVSLFGAPAASITCWLWRVRVGVAC